MRNITREALKSMLLAGLGILADRLANHLLPLEDSILSDISQIKLQQLVLTLLLILLFVVPSLIYLAFRYREFTSVKLRKEKFDRFMEENKLHWTGNRVLATHRSRKRFCPECAAEHGQLVEINETASMDFICPKCGHIYPRILTQHQDTYL